MAQLDISLRLTVIIRILVLLLLSFHYHSILPSLLLSHIEKLVLPLDARKIKHNSRRKLDRKWIFYHAATHAAIKTQTIMPSLSIGAAKPE